MPQSDHCGTTTPRPGSRWQQPRTGRIFEVERVDGDGLAWCRRTTRGGNWTRDAAGLLPTDFLAPGEDSLLDNIMGWRLVPVASDEERQR